MVFNLLGDKNSPYRDYYIWKDPVDDEVPNNWQSKFGGSAWELDGETGQYYLHFAKEQADLNWENPEVRQAVKDVISFWAEKGVDGFRHDVINLISKQQDFPRTILVMAAVSTPMALVYTNICRKSVKQRVFRKYGSVTVGEMSSTSLEHCQRYSSLDNKELSMVFNFHHLKVDYPNGEKMDQSAV